METLAISLPHEQVLVARAQADRAAFAEVYDHFFRRVYNYVRYRVNEPDAADDLTAQIFEQVLCHLAEYRPKRGPFAAWLFRIARNRVRDHLRHERRHPQVPLGSLEERIGDHTELADQVAAKQTRARALALVAELKEREREIIALKFGAGLTNRQIADLMDLSESNVGVILYRTLRALRQHLRDDGEE